MSRCLKRGEWGRLRYGYREATNHSVLKGFYHDDLRRVGREGAKHKL